MANEDVGYALVDAAAAETTTKTPTIPNEPLPSRPSIEPKCLPHDKHNFSKRQETRQTTTKTSPLTTKATTRDSPTRSPSPDECGPMQKTATTMTDQTKPKSLPSSSQAENKHAANPSHASDKNTCKGPAGAAVAEIKNNDSDQIGDDGHSATAATAPVVEHTLKPCHKQSLQYVCTDCSAVVHWNDEDLFVAWNAYDPLHQRVSMLLVMCDDGQVFEYITAEVPPAQREDFSHNELLIKTYSECEGVMEALLAAKVVEEPSMHYRNSLGGMLAKCKVRLVVPSFERVRKELASNYEDDEQRRAQREKMQKEKVNHS